MLGFWPQLVFVLLALYFAGRVFGRPLLPIPLLMSFVPFAWHVFSTRAQLRAITTDAATQALVSDALERYLALSIGFAVILLTVGLAWAWRYSFSVFVFPLIMLFVYIVGPWHDLSSRLPQDLLSPNTASISSFAVLASLCLLAYTLPTILAWLRPKP
jgi:hypothetical protein